MTTPYFKRVLEDMQSGYQPDQTSSNSIYLRPRVSEKPPGFRNLDDYTWDAYGHVIQNKVRINSIITRLRIWVRRVEKRLRHLATNHYGGFSRNVVGRSGWDVTASLRNPTYFGQAIEQFRPHRGTAIRGYDPKLTWTKNQRARLF